MSSCLPIYYCLDVTRSYISFFLVLSDIKPGLLLSETYSCMLRLKSMSEENVVRMQPGTNETHVLYDS